MKGAGVTVWAAAPPAENPDSIAARNTAVTERALTETVSSLRNTNTLILLDGKEISEEEMKKVPLKKIKSLSVVKGVVVVNTKN